MKILDYQHTEDPLFDPIKIYAGEQLLHYGMFYDFITLESNKLGVEFNFGSQTSTPFLVKRRGEAIAFIPVFPTSNVRIWPSLIISIEQYQELWRFLKLDPEKYIEYMCPLEGRDLQTLWLSRVLAGKNLHSLEALQKEVSNITVDLEEKFEQYRELYDQLVEEDWSFPGELKSLDINFESSFQPIITYVDDQGLIEWQALQVNSNRELFLHFGNGVNIAVKNIQL